MEKDLVSPMSVFNACSCMIGRGKPAHICDNQEDIVRAKRALTQPGPDKDADADEDGGEHGEKYQKHDACVVVIHGSEWERC